MAWVDLISISSSSSSSLSLSFFFFFLSSFLLFLHIGSSMFVIIIFGLEIES